MSQHYYLWDLELLFIPKLQEALAIPQAQAKAEISKLYWRAWGGAENRDYRRKFNRLNKREYAEFEELVQRRCAGEPIDLLSGRPWQRDEILSIGITCLTEAGIPPNEAKPEVGMLLRTALGISKENLFLNPHATISLSEFDALMVLITRRARREPLAYITGEREFYGLTFKVTPAVLIPRPETEHLVEAVLEPNTGSSGSPLLGQGGNLLDVGTGSGCIVVALAKALPGAQVWATDLSEEALAVARENASRHGVTIRFLQGDLLAPLPPELRFDAIVSNPPYIARSETPSLEPEVKDFEPSLALFDTQDDGLGFYRRLAQEAVPRLAPGGRLLVEVGMGQAEAVAALWHQAALENIEIIPDYAGIGRVVTGQSGSCAPGR